MNIHFKLNFNLMVVVPLELAVSILNKKIIIIKNILKCFKILKFMNIYEHLFPTYSFHISHVFVCWFYMLLSHVPSTDWEVLVHLVKRSLSTLFVDPLHVWCNLFCHLCCPSLAFLSCVASFQDKGAIFTQYSKCLVM